MRTFVYTRHILVAWTAFAFACQSTGVTAQTAPIPPASATSHATASLVALSCVGDGTYDAATVKLALPGTASPAFAYLVFSEVATHPPGAARVQADAVVRDLLIERASRTSQADQVQFADGVIALTTERTLNFPSTTPTINTNAAADGARLSAVAPAAQDLLARGMGAVQTSEALVRQARYVASTFDKTVEEATRIALAAARQNSESHMRQLAAQLADPARTAAVAAQVLPNFGELADKQKRAFEAKVQSIVRNAEAQLLETPETQIDELARKKGDLVKSLEEVSAVLSETQGGFNAAINDLTAFQKAATNVAVELRKATVNIEREAKNAGAQLGGRGVYEVLLLQQQTLEKLKPDQLVSLAKTGLTGVVATERKALLTNLEVFRKGGAPEKLDAALGIVSQFKGVVQALGGNIDTRNLERNVSVAKQGFGLVKSFLAGGPLGLATSFGSILGGAGGVMGDPDAERRHQEVMAELNKIYSKLEDMDKKLDTIISLQQETLKEVRELQRQLQDSTRVLMTALGRLEQDQIFFFRLLTSASYNQPVNGCRNFVNGAVFAGLRDNGSFACYQQRVAHYTNDIRSLDKYFGQCAAFLGSMNVALLPQNGEYSLVLSADFEERAKPRTTRLPHGTVGRDTFQSKEWEPLWYYTQDALHLTGKPNCTARLMARLATAPEQADSLEDLSCSVDKDLPTDAASYRGYQHKDPLRANTAMWQALYFPSVRRFGEYLTFISLYNGVMAPPQAGGERLLLSPNSLTKVEGATTQGLHWMRGYEDIVNLNIAQEAVLAGVPVAKLAAQELVNAEFGAKERERMAPARAAREAWFKDKVAVNLTKWKEEASRVTGATFEEGEGVAGRLIPRSCPDASEKPYWAHVCHMTRYPFLRANVMIQLTRQGLKWTGTIPVDDLEALEYSLGYYMKASDDRRGHWAALLPQYPIVADRANATDNGGWSVVLVGMDGVDDHVALPAPFFVQQGLFLYSPQMSEVLDYKKSVKQRIAYFGLQEQLVTSGRASRGTHALLQQMAASVENPLKLNVPIMRQ